MKEGLSLLLVSLKEYHKLSKNKGVGDIRELQKFPSIYSFAKNLRRRSTSSERVLWKLLRTSRFHIKNEIFNFRRQHPISRFIVDFYCPKTKLIIELDGGYHFASKEQIEYDKLRTEILEELGYNLIRFKNKDLRISNLNNVLYRIKKEILFTYTFVENKGFLPSIESL